MRGVRLWAPPGSEHLCGLRVGRHGLDLPRLPTGRVEPEGALVCVSARAGRQNLCVVDIARALRLHLYTTMSPLIRQVFSGIFSIFLFAITTRIRVPMANLSNSRKNFRDWKAGVKSARSARTRVLDPAQIRGCPDMVEVEIVQPGGSLGMSTEYKRRFGPSALRPSRDTRTARVNGITPFPAHGL